MITSMDISKFLRAKKDESGLSNEAFAALLDVHISSLEKWMYGESFLLQERTIAKLQECFPNAKFTRVSYTNVED